MDFLVARLLALAALLIAVLGAAACDERDPEAVAPARAASQDSERALCLVEVPGLGAVARARAARRAAVVAHEDRLEAWVGLGHAWVATARNSGDPGFYVHADACARHVLGADPENLAAQDLRVVVLLNDHRFAEAREAARRILARNPEDTSAWGSLSDALLELGDIEGAERAAQEMMNRKPSLPSYSRASYLRWLRGDEEGALEAARLAHAAGLDRRNPEPAAFVQSDAANILYFRGDIPGALAGYEEALAEKPDLDRALAGKARCLVALGRPREALPLLERALAHRPRVDTAWWVAKVYALLGDAETAERALERAIALGKSSDPRRLAVLLATVNREIDVARRSIEKDNRGRGGPYADDAMALVLYRAGDLAGAKRESAAALRLGTPDPRLDLHRGVILLVAGDAKQRAEGQRLVERALSRGMRFDPDAVAMVREVQR